MACEAAGKRLPTIHQLAERVEALKAPNSPQAIVELSAVTNGKVPAGYHRIASTKPDGTGDPFYFNPAGYQTPKGDLGTYWFWSSSGYPAGHRFSHDDFISKIPVASKIDALYAHVLRGDDGGMEVGWERSLPFAVLCVPR